MILLDTNALIYFFAGDNSIDYLFESIEEIGISIITKIELLGYPNLNNQNQIEDFLGSLKIIYVDNQIADETIKLKQKYKLKTPDAIICASAIFNQAKLITKDKRLKKIKELLFINPFGE